VHVDSVNFATAGALQSAPGDTHTLMLSADSHAHPPPTADSVTLKTADTNVTAVACDAHLLSLLAPAPADSQHATLSAPDCLTSDHTPATAHAEIRSATSAPDYSVRATVTDDTRPPLPDSGRAVSMATGLIMSEREREREKKEPSKTSNNNFNNNNRLQWQVARTSKRPSTLATINTIENNITKYNIKYNKIMTDYK